MSVVAADVIEMFPEFSSVPAATISAHIDMATQCIDEILFGEKSDLAIILLSCHTMATSQFGERLALRSDTERSAYGAMYQRLSRQAGASWRVV